MKHHLVDCVLVDTFDDIDLAVDGPCTGAQTPECRPTSASTAGHVLQVNDKETLGVRRFGLDAYTGTSDAVADSEGSLVVNTNVVVIPDQLEHVLVCCGALIKISEHRSTKGVTHREF